MHILIVDETAVSRSSFRDLLRAGDTQVKYIFHEASCLADLPIMLATGRYDCIFVAQRLADGDGVEALPRLTEGQSGITVAPVIMLADTGAERTMLQALRQGAQDYVVRDALSPETLTLAMHKALEMHRMRRNHQSAEQELMQRRKMDAVGQLTSGVAHDFNNLLTVVIGNTHLLRRRLKAGLETCDVNDLSAKIEAIATVSAKGADLVRRLMVFTRQSPLERSSACPNTVINETVALLARTLGAEIEIEAPLGEEIWPVCIDVPEFQNMLINFALNARDAMPAGGRLVIETENVHLDDSYVWRNPDFTPGRYVMIAVSDTGCGMPADIAKRIFEPFYTTKPAGQGTGLGLSMAYGFIQQCGGHIHVYSEPGHGSVFRIYLPADLQAVDIETIDDALPRGRETVLVAEDDDELRHCVSLSLERLGYRTIQAPNGHVALEVLRRDWLAIDLVFADVMMPGALNGVELAAEVRMNFPRVKVLLTSGYSERAMPVQGLEGPLISKPYRREALATKLRQVLDFNDTRMAGHA